MRVAFPLLYRRVMTTRSAPLFAAFAMAAALVSGACTGGSESKAADEKSAVSTEASAAPQQPIADAQQALGSINRAIPIYEGAEFRPDLSRRDQVAMANKYGSGATVYTLASDDSFPQVYHYYTTYLAQFRAFPAQETYPSSRKNWRTLEVKLNEAMQDPFIPGQELDRNGQQVTLQISETEQEPKTVIRYIVTPAGTAPAAPQVATTTTAHDTEPAAVAR